MYHVETKENYSDYVQYCPYVIDQATDALNFLLLWSFMIQLKSSFHFLS